jgi:hypothetical protein
MYDQGNGGYYFGMARGDEGVKRAYFISFDFDFRYVSKGISK